MPSQPEPLQTTQPEPANPPSTHRAWYVLLILPYLGLCFPAFYARLTPTLFGMPFFYWYQFAWVLLSSVLMAIVYFRTKP